MDALDDLYVAEVARARDHPDQVELWRRAADDLDQVCPWDAAYAAYRAGESVLLHRGRSRGDAVALLRRAVALASELEAEPVLREATRLATAARVPIGTLTALSAKDGGTLPGLTRREREIVAHVAAGRTYGEIARALFISEKTVSSHVSDILRKTGCANRITPLAEHSQPRRGRRWRSRLTAGGRSPLRRRPPRTAHDDRSFCAVARQGCRGSG